MGGLQYIDITTQLMGGDCRAAIGVEPLLQYKDALEVVDEYWCAGLAAADGERAATEGEGRFRRYACLIDGVRGTYIHVGHYFLHKVERKAHLRFSGCKHEFIALVGHHWLPGKGEAGHLAVFQIDAEGVLQAIGINAGYILAKP